MQEHAAVLRASHAGTCCSQSQSKADIRSVQKCARFFIFIFFLLSLMTASVFKKKNLSLAFSLRLWKQAVLRKI